MFDNFLIIFAGFAGGGWVVAPGEAALGWAG